MNRREEFANALSTFPLIGWIRKRPLVWTAIIFIVALLVGVGIGSGGEEGDDGPVADDGELAAERDQLAEDVASLTDEVREARAEARQHERRADRLARRAQEAQAEEHAEEEEAEDGAQTVGQFEFADVQVSEDGVGDFEVRTRVTNTGEATEFTQIEATVFNEGSVVAALRAIEDFDAGQTRTVTLIGTDEFGPWDDIEFTVD